MRGEEICALECNNFFWKEENPEIAKDFITIRNKPHLQLFVKTKFSERTGIISIHPFWRAHLRSVCP
jgi:hypothetical protein